MLPPEIRCDRNAPAAEGDQIGEPAWKGNWQEILEATEVFTHLERIFQLLGFSFKAVCRGRKASLGAHR